MKKLHPEKISNMNPIINNYYWEGINHPVKIEDWKRFEKNLTIGLNDLDLKKSKYALPIFQKLIQFVENN